MATSIWSFTRTGRINHVCDAMVAAFPVERVVLCNGRSVLRWIELTWALVGSNIHDMCNALFRYSIQHFLSHHSDKSTQTRWTCIAKRWYGDMSKDSKPPASNTTERSPFLSRDILTQITSLKIDFWIHMHRCHLSHFLASKEQTTVVQSRVKSEGRWLLQQRRFGSSTPFKTLNCRNICLQSSAIIGLPFHLRKLDTRWCWTPTHPR